MYEMPGICYNMAFPGSTRLFVIFNEVKFCLFEAIIVYELRF
ncbi:hypothetical protein B0I18_1011256 [Taibaiella chishuiensis]|uniref:Uncharacterized protein n=1 Tax=Taibaiella chishuiensis TaxID=1434707 RepID=A0A2P8DD06_9BACT|nr:hypothetical protein B0I18_1011256 [Taibaiella chishuiensis]